MKFETYNPDQGDLLPIADLLRKFHKHAQPPERRHHPRRLAQHDFPFAKNRGKFSLHCSVAPSMVSNQLQSNGLLMITDYSAIP